jgi:hypothetical protein
MPSQPPYFDITRYLISYSHPNFTLRISATSMSSRRPRIFSYQDSGIHRTRDMSSGYPAVRSLRNGFGWSRMANNAQPFHADEDRFLGYPNALLNIDGPPTPTPMSYTSGIPVGTAVPLHELFNTPMANNDRRRRSSFISPRTIQTSNYRTPYSNSFPPSGPQNPTPPSSNIFTSHTTQTQAAAESNFQAFNRASLSTITATSRRSTTSTYTEAPTATLDHNQRAIFALVSEICTEALRRKWHDETQRQSIRSLASRRPRSSRHRRRSHGRYSPYAPLSAPQNPHSHTAQRPQRTGATTTPADPPLRFMDLMQRIATVTWENAIQPQPAQDMPNGAAPTSGEPETAAIESMRTLYSLGNSIVAATSAATRGDNFNLDEIKDIVGVAARFCRVLGYGEGAERCEEVGRRPLEERRQGAGWEGGVL